MIILTTEDFAFFREKPYTWFEMVEVWCSQKWPVFKETVAQLANIQLGIRAHFCLHF